MGEWQLAQLPKNRSVAAAMYCLENICEVGELARVIVVKFPIHCGAVRNTSFADCIISSFVVIV